MAFGVNIIGPTILEQPIRIEEDRVYGRSFTRTVEGWAPDVLTLMASTRPNSESRSYSQSGGLGSLQVRFAATTEYDGSSETALNEATLRTNRGVLSIFKHPTYAALIPEVVEVIQRVIHDGTMNYTQKLAAVRGENPQQADLAEDAFSLLLYGDDSWIVTQSYTLVRSRTASRFYDFQLAYANDGKLFSTAQLVGYAGVVLPLTIPTMPATANTDKVATADAWLKEGTDVHILANGNNQVVETWTSGRWTTKLYPFAT